MPWTRSKAPQAFPNTKDDRDLQRGPYLRMVLWLGEAVGKGNVFGGNRLSWAQAGEEGSGRPSGLSLCKTSCGIHSQRSCHPSFHFSWTHLYREKYLVLTSGLQRPWSSS